MSYYEVVRLLWNQVIIYLRKSRSDDPNQSVEDVLQKHETQLQEYAERELGGRIPEENIYREVVSGGESLAEREAIMAVLARCEDPNIKGVLVIEPQRLSRGSLTDCDKLMTTFELTGTFVVTPMMTYDLSRKMERKFFQDELMRGRDYLEYTKEILTRGRIAAVKRGCYIAHRPPYGYKKVTVNGDHTLEPLPDQADIVRLVFESFVHENMTPFQIACRLNDMGVKTQRDMEWRKDTIRKVLRNEHYIGKVLWNQRKMTQVLEHGEVKTVRMQSDPDDIIAAPGKHEALISLELWEATQARISLNVPTADSNELKNIFSGLLRCEKCGGMMERSLTKGALPRFSCRRDPRCYKSVREDFLTQAILDSLEQSELPALQMKLKNREGDAGRIQARQLKALEKQMAEYIQQEDTQYELLEKKEYTPEVFARRHTALRKKMDECKDQIQKAKAAMPKSVNYEARIASLQTAIDMVKDPTATPKEKNRALKAIVQSIDYSSVPPRSGRTANNKPHPFTLDITLKL